jgi:hypothetical protein
LLCFRTASNGPARPRRGWPTWIGWAPTPAATASTPTAPPSEAPASTEAPAAAPPAAKAAEPATTKPSKAQISHIRQVCRADYRAHCAGVTAGASGLACLKNNVASLSAPCRLVLGDASVGNTSQAPPAPTVSDELPVVSPREEIFIMRSACGPDFRTYCEELRPAGRATAWCAAEPVYMYEGAQRRRTGPAELKRLGVNLICLSDGTTSQGFVLRGGVFAPITFPLAKCSSRAFAGKIESTLVIPIRARIRFKITTGARGPVVNGETILRRSA